MKLGTGSGQGLQLPFSNQTCQLFDIPEPELAPKFLLHNRPRRVGYSRISKFAGIFAINLLHNEFI